MNFLTKYGKGVGIVLITIGTIAYSAGTGVPLSPIPELGTIGAGIVMVANAILGLTGPRNNRNDNDGELPEGGHLTTAPRRMPQDQRSRLDEFDWNRISEKSAYGSLVLSVRLARMNRRRDTAPTCSPRRLMKRKQRNAQRRDATMALHYISFPV